MIRAAKKSDFEKILPLCARFWKETEFDEPFDSEQPLNILELAHNYQLLAVAEKNGEIVGVSAGVKSPLLGNSTVFSGIEMVWWIEPEHRGRLGAKLFAYMEILAKQAGIKYWCMSSLQSSNPHRVNAFYERRGYHLTEMTFMRRLL